MGWYSSSIIFEVVWLDKKKKNELLRKRNSDLNNRLKDLKSELEFIRNVNSEGYKKAKSLIEELENIKNEWDICLNDLKSKQEEYDSIIFSLKKLKNGVLKTPWYIKFFKSKTK